MFKEESYKLDVGVVKALHSQGKLEGRPLYLVCLDKDGTTDLTDPELNSIFSLIKTTKGEVVITTGRTPADVIDEYQKHGINVTPYIIADNGAIIVHDGEIIAKKTLAQDKIRGILTKFRESGGDISLIRATDGEKIYAADTPEVREYYTGKNIVEFIPVDEIEERLIESDGITKITLAGSKEMMSLMAEFSEGIDYWSDEGKTSFPKKEHKNMRLDISQRDINKGNGVKQIVGMLKPALTYFCVGDGKNDFSMFQVALDDGANAVVIDENEELVGMVRAHHESNGGRGTIHTVRAGKRKANPELRRIADYMGRVYKDAIEAELHDLNTAPEVGETTSGKLPDVDDSGLR